MTELAFASIGDHGALNTQLPEELTEIWIDRKEKPAIKGCPQWGRDDLQSHPRRCERF